MISRSIRVTHYVTLEQTSVATRIDENRFYKLFLDPGGLTRLE